MTWLPVMSTFLLDNKYSVVLNLLPYCYWTHIYIYIYIYIQGVSRLVHIPAGGDFLGLCDQKSSYKHVSDFGRLRSYGHCLIPFTPSCESRLMEPAGGWSTQLGGLSFALQALFVSPDSRSSQPSGSLFCGRW